MEGVWKWEATYNGETVTHSLNIGTLSVEEESLENSSIYPNPVDEVLNIQTRAIINSANIYDLTGKSILQLDGNNSNGVKSIDTSNLSKGLYFLKLRGEMGETKVLRFIKD